MEHTTQAVVLRTIAHGDHSVVMKAYTELFGLRSYLVRASKRKNTLAILAPLNRLEMVVIERPDKDLQHVREVRIARPFVNVQFDPLRSAVALFVQEVLYKVLREESQDEDLFELIDKALSFLDESPDLRHFPIQFLLALSGHLGFRPATPRKGEDRFDLKEGHFVMGHVPHDHTMGPPLTHALARLLELKDLEPPPFVMPLEHRRLLLDRLLFYYRLHVEGLTELRSPAVLHQVLS